MRLVIPEEQWAEMLARFAQQKPGDERIGYLDGFISNDLAVVTTVTIPEAECTPRYYTVKAEHMSEAGGHLRRFGMRRLAQVHTHGGADTTASRRDEQLAYSQRPGALSIILPFHAAQQPSPTSGSVNLRADDGWKRLTTQDAEESVLVVPSILDFRRQTWNESRHGMMVTLAAVFGRRMKLARRVFRSRSLKT
jgi:proteasome lid subunit RPN8/RPN11